MWCRQPCVLSGLVVAVLRVQQEETVTPLLLLRLQPLRPHYNYLHLLLRRVAAARLQQQQQQW